MKKITCFAILAFLLSVILGGCITILDDTTVADYRELEDLFRYPGEASFNGEFFIDILNAEDAAVRYSTTGSYSFFPDASQTIYDFRTPGDAPIFEISVIDVNSRLYISLDYMIHSTLEAFGVFDEPESFDGIDLSPEALFGAYKYVDFTFDESMEWDEPIDWDEDQVCICYIFSNEDLRRYLSREGDIFTIAIEGDSVRRVVESYMESFLLEFALGGIWYVEEHFPDIARFLNNAGNNPSRIVRGADLTDAYIVVERWQIGGVLHQTLELYIPDRVYISATAAYDTDHVPPIAPPERYLSIDDFYDRIMDAIWGDFDVNDFDIPELDMIYDLVGLRLTLLDHDLSDSSFLESHVLQSPSGLRQNVTVITDGDLHEIGPDEIFWDAWAIELYYSLVPGNNAASVITDAAAFALLGDPLHVGLLWTNIDYQKAMLGIVSDTFGFSVGALYLAEAIPDTEYVLLLELLLFSELLDDMDFDILDELSAHIGIDLAEHIADLFDEAF